MQRFPKKISHNPHLQFVGCVENLLFMRIPAFPLGVVVACFVATAWNLHAQVTHADVQPLWDELSAFWSENDLAGAEAAADKLVKALEPVETDFTMGIQANSALHNRASLRYNIGDYAGAEEDLKRSVEQAKAIQPPAGIPAAAAPQMMGMVEDRVRISLRGLMNFYLAAGDLERATEAFESAIQLVPHWKNADQNNPTMAYSVLAAEVSSMEGTFYRATGDYAKAADAFLDRIEDLESAWNLVLKSMGGQENDFTDQMKMNYLRGRANLLMELAEVTSLLEKHEDAVAFVKQAQEAAAGMFPLYKKWAENAPKTNPMLKPETIQKTLEGVETNMNYLAFERSALVLRAAGQEKAALDLMLEGIKRRGEDFEQQRMLTLEYNVIRPEESFRMIGDLQAILEQYDEAAASYAKSLDLIAAQYPEGHPAILDVKESQVLLLQKKGDAAAAEALAKEVLEGRMKNLEDVLTFADESQRLSYRSSIDPWSLFASLGQSELLYETVLKTKGIVLESILEEKGIAKDASDPAVAEALAQLEEARRKLMELLLSGADDSETVALKAEIEGLEEKLKSADPDMGKARESLDATVDEVANAIPADAVLIEFIRYRAYSAPGRFVPRYGAVVLKAKGKPVFVPLAEAVKVEAGMETYAKAVRSNAPDEDMKKFLQALGAAVWDPLAKELPAPGKRIILSPDGALNFLSFATLFADGEKFVGETWPLSYVSSGRDLLRKNDSTRKDSMQIIANPDFQTPATEDVAGARNIAGDAAVTMRGMLGRIGLSPLPGTKAEEAALRELISKEWKWDIESHLEKEATEESVNAVDSPGVLHLATHGFYLPRTGRSDPMKRVASYWESSRGGSQQGQPLEAFSDVVLDNPMHRSGIALAGAEATLKQWGAGRILDTSKDGVLTAEEMALLDLDGTWLVVLSACETGLGEIRAGEGVLGMRRGLIEAGAQNLLLTLWPVADKETAMFMVDLYRNLDGGKKDPVQVSPAVQAAYLKKFREEKGITQAVKLAGPFILSYQP
ncbi:MAG: hypothetical protein CMO55_11215 [Verrucomicrobiales bacterium]|nr:hypothetical protein [Verrucomicrobiales bacterium]